MCSDNLNQDASLIIEFGDCLIIDLNDSPVGSDRRFLRSWRGTMSGGRLTSWRFVRAQLTCLMAVESVKKSYTV
jgi:hypothetical protein